MSKLLADPTTYIDDKTYIKITNDLDTSYEDVIWLKEQFEQKLNAKEVSIIPPPPTPIITNDANVMVDFQSVDTIVISHLNAIESDSINKQKLIELYNLI